jgi:hypothetical protein
LRLAARLRPRENLRYFRELPLIAERPAEHAERVSQRISIMNDCATWLYALYFRILLPFLFCRYKIVT